MKYIFLLFIFLTFSNYSQAAQNVALNGTASISIVSGSQTGATSNVNDGDLNTLTKVENTDPLSAPCEYTLTVTFDGVYDVNEIQIKHALAGIDVVNVTTYNVQLFYGGTWNTIISKSGQFATVTDSQVGSWSGCSGMRVDVNVVGLRVTTSAFISSQIFEMIAFGTQGQNYIINFL